MCTAHVPYTKASSSAQVGAQPLTVGLGAHKIYHYIGGSLCSPGAQPQPSVMRCCAQKSYIPPGSLCHSSIILILYLRCVLLCLGQIARSLVVQHQEEIKN